MRSRPLPRRSQAVKGSWSASAPRQLVSVLVRKREVRGELACFREKRRERIRAKCLELVDVHEERHALVRRERAALHRGELEVRDEKRAEQVRRLLPYRPFGQVRDEDAPTVHRELEIGRVALGGGTLQMAGR